MSGNIGYAGAVGTVGVLNVGAGDTKLSFDKTNPAERARAARIVTEMIRLGYSLLVEVDRDGLKLFTRITEFDENTCEYIISDLDPAPAVEQESGAKPRSAKIVKRRLDAEKTRAVSVGRTAGG